MAARSRLLRWAWTWVAPLVLPWALLFAAVAWPPGAPIPRRSIPTEARHADRCTWACHNRGCSHRPALPAVITDDRYVFGATIRALYALGTLFSRDRFRGYGIANILVFCLAWPALMYALWVSAWRQRFRVSALRAALAAKGAQR
ncbi:MAG: hypothetical protein U0269_08975 [Polyangiales bacterium]